MSDSRSSSPFSIVSALSESDTDGDGVLAITNGVSLLMNDDELEPDGGNTQQATEDIQETNVLTERALGFFGRFTDFQVNKNATSTRDEFTRLAKQCKWSVGGENWSKNWTECFGETFDGVQEVALLVNPNFTLPMALFFAGFKEFQLNASANPVDEFKRLSDHCHWAVGLDDWRKNWKACFDNEYEPHTDKAPVVSSLTEKVSPQEIPVSEHAVSKRVPRTATKTAQITSSVPPSEKAITKIPAIPNKFLEAMRVHNFVPNYEATLESEMIRLARNMGWQEDSFEFRGARMNMLVYEASRWYPDETNLKQWQNLCVGVGISPTPVSITKCRLELLRLNINIVNYLNYKRGTEPLKYFKTKYDLLRYTIPKNLFPKEKAKKGCLRGLLKYF